MRYKCNLCGRDRFTRKTPHNCVGGYRKHGLKWTPIPEKELEIKVINMEKQIVKDYFEDKSFKIAVPFSLEEHIEYLQGLKDKYGDVKLVMALDSDDYVDLVCLIEREETDEEFEKRKKDYEERQAFIRKIEMQKLAELKAKYEQS